MHSVRFIFIFILQQINQPHSSIVFSQAVQLFYGKLHYEIQIIIIGLKYIQIMSKLSIRFIYKSQQDQEIKSVKSIHRGPVNLNNLYETFANPSYHDIDLNENNLQTESRNQQNGISFERQIPPVPTVEVISKPTSPKFSEKRLQSPQSRISQNAFEEQFKAKRVEKIQSPKQTRNIEESSECQYIKNPQSRKQIPKQSQMQIPQGQIVLKSPSFKFIPKLEGELNHGNRKEYIRAEKAEKYLYNGIPEKSEDDFIGCFGCFEKKPKTFKATHK